MGKKIYIFYDGTDNSKGKSNTNVWILFLLLAFGSYDDNNSKLNAADLDKVEEIKENGNIYLYFPGIGYGAFKEGLMDKIWNSFGRKNILDEATGKSCQPRAVEVYEFIMKNYENGDEIYMVGFSRGAYIVRIVCGLLSVVGLLDNDKKPLDEQTKEMFLTLMQSYHNVTYESSLKDFASLNKDIIEGLDSKKYYFKGFRNGEYQAINKVRFLGLFDTVGAADGLGGHPDSFETPYLRDLVVTPVIQSVVHLVSVNEKRKSFQVCHAERRNDGQKDKCDPVYTIWFPGVHGDIGGAVGVDKGSYKNGERAISDSTLYVMYQNITQLTITYCFDTLVFQEWVKTLFKRDYYPMQFQQAIAHMKFNYSSNIAGFEDRVFVTLDSVPYMFNKGNWSFMFIDGLKSLRFYGLNHIYFVSQFCKNQISLQ